MVKLNLTLLDEEYMDLRIALTSAITQEFCCNSRFPKEIILNHKQTADRYTKLYYKIVDNTQDDV